MRRVHTPDESVWQYAYDPFGRRIGKACVRGDAKTLPRRVSYLWTGSLLSEERRVYADGSEQTVAYHATIWCVPSTGSSIWATFVSGWHRSTARRAVPRSIRN